MHTYELLLLSFGTYSSVRMCNQNPEKWRDDAYSIILFIYVNKSLSGGRDGVIKVRENIPTSLATAFHRRQSSIGSGGY
jgi:hypothetical protein